MKDLRAADDASLLGAEARSAEAFGVFYRRHADAVLAYCARRGLDAYEAADITAETFIAALRARRRYQPEAGEARAWLSGIAAHKIADRARHSAREQAARLKFGADLIELTERDLADYTQLLEAEGGPALEALSALPERQQAAVRARVVEEEDYAGIGRRLKLPPATVRQRVRRGLAALRIRMEDEK